MSQNSISKSAKHILNKHALSFVNALCKSTHTREQYVDHPQVRENDAPFYSVYVCVVCVGGVRRSERTLFFQRIPSETQRDPHTKKTPPLISIHRQRVNNVYKRLQKGYKNENNERRITYIYSVTKRRKTIQKPSNKIVTKL